MLPTAHTSLAFPDILNVFGSTKSKGSMSFLLSITTIKTLEEYLNNSILADPQPHKYRTNEY